ncbi:MAG TPA: cytochrome c3 family protein [Planctomycetota bacterium]|jgi:hypothetical protein
MSDSSFAFPKWTNTIRPAVGGVLLIAPVYVVLLVWYGASPKTTAVGYAPVQPVPYSHALHVGKLGLDCRYCHTTVENNAFAALPATQFCMNCHASVLPESPKLLPMREAFAAGMPVKWIKVHDLPQYVYFNHGSHVQAGVGCVSCHGRIDRMDTVAQVQTLSMSWCLDCHRNPEPNLRPTDQVTNMGWIAPEDPVQLGTRLRKEKNINPRTDCSTCHR